MNTLTTKSGFVVCFLIALLFCTACSNAQGRQQVWADEFNETAIDRTTWSFDSGPANDNITINVPSEATASFNVDMGGHTGRYYFDDFALTTPELTQSNQIENPDFSNGDSAWTLSTLWPAQATAAVENGEYAVSISHGGTNVWDINAGQAGLLIENGKRYIVSFDAYAAAPRQISALVGKNAAPWTIYSGSQVISLTTTKKTYTYSFTMNYETDSQARLGFDIGGSSTDVVFDNIMLQ